MENKTKKDAKQKSFFFEDYNESEFIVNDNKINHVKISLNRITFLFFIFLSLIIIFSTKIIYLSLSPEKNFFSDNINQNFIKKRGDIVDRNGIIIARNHPSIISRTPTFSQTILNRKPTQYRCSIFSI